MEQFITLIRQWIDKAIYVWGGQGETTSEADIRRRETSTANADRAVALYRKRQAQGIDPVIKFDCSGLVIWALQTMGLIGYDTTADGIYDKCSKIAKGNLRLGDFTFRVGSDGDAHHIGIVTRIVNGVAYVTEARGRDYGVVENPVDQWPGYWETFGQNPFIKEEVDLIKKGDKDNGLVRSWQEALIKLGFSVGSKGADDWFGDKTEQGTKDFQARFGLPQTGVVDAATATKMMDALRLIPNVDVGPYNEKIAQQQLDLDKANAAAETTTGELRTLAGILKKYS